MVINGQLKLSLVNLEVEEDPAYNGYGVYISAGATVWDNQSFMLTALGINQTPTDYRLVNNGTYDYGIVVRS